MMRTCFRLFSVPLVAVSVLLLVGVEPAKAYIGGPPASLGHMCWWSTHAMVVRVEHVDKQKRIIVYRKVQDIKGKWPSDIVRHVIGPGHGERPYMLEWAEPGKTVMMYALESYKWSHTYIDKQWYESNTTDWVTWNVSHVDSRLMTIYTGTPEKLRLATMQIYAGREVIVPCMIADKPADLITRKGKVHRMKASLKLLDYNPKRDFIGWGGDDFDRVLGMPGFTQFAPLLRLDPEAQAIACVDLDGDGKLDLCLAGAGKLALLQNAGDAFLEVTDPNMKGGRAAVWADYNGDGKPDLLLATQAGPKLFTNLGTTGFRDDSHLLPQEDVYHITAAAWIDHDGDGRPDILLGNGYHGLRLYRNKGKAELPPPIPLAKGAKPPAVKPLPRWFEDVSAQVGLGPTGIGANLKGDALTICEVDGDGRPDFLYSAGAGLLVLNTPNGFVVGKESGIEYQPGKIGPVFGDFNNDSRPDLFVPQADGRCLLFRNDGAGKFTNVTAKAGDLGKSLGRATCAAWGDFDNDGNLDLLIGCLKGPNRYLRNRGDGTFEDATEVIGLHKRIFNTQAICLADLNSDGALDAVFLNEGQDSVALLGNPALSTKRTSVALHLAGGGAVGSRIRVSDDQGKLLSERAIFGSEGRGGQTAPVAYFALLPGSYSVEVRFSGGAVRARKLTVADTPLRSMFDERTP